MSLYSVSQNIKEQIMGKIDALDTVHVVYPAEKINPNGS